MIIVIIIIVIMIMSNNSLFVSTAGALVVDLDLDELQEEDGIEVHLRTDPGVR